MTPLCLRKKIFFITLHRRRREETEERTDEGECVDVRSKSQFGSKSEIAWVVQTLTSLWLKTHLATSRDCLQKLMCISNNDIAQRSSLAWTLAESGRYVLNIGNLITLKNNQK